jgi:hypothetical protein
VRVSLGLVCFALEAQVPHANSVKHIRFTASPTDPHQVLESDVELKTCSGDRYMDDANWIGQNTLTFCCVLSQPSELCGYFIPYSK